ncbi:hypothetical protein EOL70_26990 [Leucothrix sargassi]|nr:hypothetical protein EOL70_26990 [Leucothrix sargassi]
MKKLSTAIIFTFMAFFATTIPSIASANQAYTCDSATKVIRDYKGNPQAWKNRNLYEQSRKATLYFESHCTGANSGHVVNANLSGKQTASIRPATCKDCYDAGYRKGVEAGQIAARRASSVTNPLIQPPVVTAAVAAPKPAPARTVYVSAYQPPKSPVAMIKHGNHSHHSEAERLDCELTDALNRRAGPVTSVIRTVKTPAAFNKVNVARKAPMMIRHGDHMHHTEVEKADCALTDALNRRSGPVVKTLRHHH